MARVEITKGTTVQVPIRMESDLLVYKPIDGVEATTPLRLKVPVHGCLQNWRCGFVSGDGLEPINAKVIPPRDSEMYTVTVIDEDTVEFNLLNSADWGPYTGGGYLVFWQPIDLSVYESAEMHVRDKVGGVSLATFPLTVDSPIATLWLNRTAEQSAEVAFAGGVFAMRGTRGNGTTDPLGGWDNMFVVNL